MHGTSLEEEQFTSVVGKLWRALLEKSAIICLILRSTLAVLDKYCDAVPKVANVEDLQDCQKNNFCCLETFFCGFQERHS